MEPAMSVLVDGVLTAARGAGLTEASLKYQRSCCATVARYCTDHAIDEYNEQVRERFLAEQDTRLKGGNTGPIFPRWRRVSCSARNLSRTCSLYSSIAWSVQYLATVAQQLL